MQSSAPASSCSPLRSRPSIELFRFTVIEDAVADATWFQFTVIVDAVDSADAAWFGSEGRF